MRDHQLTSVEDPLEKMLEDCLKQNKMPYTRPERLIHEESTLDFHLTNLGVSIEVKAWSCERMHDQLRDSKQEANGIIVLIGLPAVRTFVAFLNMACKYRILAQTLPTMDWSDAN